MLDVVFLHPKKFLAGGLVAVVAAGLLLFGGCPADPATTLTGTITSGGKPVASGTVTAVAADNRTFQVPIRPDGSYAFTGLPPGPVRVAVTSPQLRVTTGPAAGSPPKPATVPPGPRTGAAKTTGPAAKDKASAFGMDPTGPPRDVGPAAGPADGRWFPIPGKYANPQTSGLGAEAGGGRFDIKAD